MAPMFNAWEMCVPVLAAQRTERGLETPRPIIYGTAFPVSPGIFVTAAHVMRGARADGIPGLSVGSPGQRMIAEEIVDFEMIEAVDLALVRCPSLARLAPVPIDFDRTLPFLAPCAAAGFPMAMDSEFVKVVPRAFSGSVVTRRELYHVPAQPPGYEVSFFAPQGLSGAPLLSFAFGAVRCYGYIIEQSTIGLGDQRTPVGIAVGIDVLLGVRASTYSNGEPLASLFGRALRAPRQASTRHLPGGVHPPNTDPTEGWPDEDLPPPSEPEDTQ